MSSAWSLFDGDASTRAVQNSSDSDSDTEQVHTQSRAPVTVPKKVEKPWNQYMPTFTLTQPETDNMFAQQKADIINYSQDPTIHPDVQSLEKHVDGFSAPPLYQSPLITVDVNMPHCGGGRGIVATGDIYPGTLLMAERTRYPFLSKKQCVKRESRVEVEFLQDLVFDMPIPFVQGILKDLSPLHPRDMSEVTETHLDFLRTVYADLIDAMIENVPADRQEVIGFTTDMLLRVVCLIHFNSFPSGISLHIAMVNHSCAPNAVKIALPRTKGSDRSVQAWDDDYNASISEIRASQFIKQGDEVTICYIPPDVSDFSLTFRQGYLRRQFQFACTCTLCRDETAVVIATHKSTAAANTTGNEEEREPGQEQGQEQGQVVAVLPDRMSFVERLMVFYFNVPTEDTIFDSEGNFYAEDEQAEIENPITCPKGVSLAAFVLSEAQKLFEHELSAYELEQAHRLRLAAAKTLVPHLQAQSYETLVTLLRMASTTSYWSILPVTKDEELVQLISQDPRDESACSALLRKNDRNVQTSLKAVLYALALDSSIAQLDVFISKFGKHTSVKYADTLVEACYALQGLLPLGALANRIVVMEPFKSKIGSMARDSGFFERDAFKTYTRICELYNQCAVDTVLQLQ